MSALPDALQARKQPLQSRARATVDAIREAASQVLLAEGLAGTTTTRVAERAGVSIGSLYQYYPNRSALLAGVLEWHLGLVADAVEAACVRCHGADLHTMATTLVEDFIQAKLAHADLSLALYAIAELHGGAALVAAGRVRMQAAAGAMLASSREARFDDPAQVATILLGALVGPMRDFMEAGAPCARIPWLRTQLTRLATSYLLASRVEA